MLTHVVACPGNKSAIDARFIRQQFGDLVGFKFNTATRAMQHQPVHSLFKRRRAESNFAIGGRGKGATIEHQFVLTPNHVQVDYRYADLRDARRDYLFPVVLTLCLVG